ncbi:Argininosuccinate lyase [Sodalis praecaptivus]
MVQGSMGAAALAGSSFPIDRQRTAALLGQEGVTHNSLDTVASRDFATELLYAVTQLSVTWGRVAQDFHTFSSDEFAIIGFPDSVAGTSSIMPQKKNPFALEFLRAESARLVGVLTGTLSAIRSTHFTVSLDAIREGLMDLWPALARAAQDLGLFAQVIATVEPRAKLMLQRCYGNFSTVTELADRMVKDHQLSFREAHHLVGLVVRLALEEGKDASQITAQAVNRAAVDMLGRELPIDDAWVSETLDPARAVRGRTHSGGTAPATIRQALAAARQQLEHDEQRLTERQQHKAAATQALETLAAERD